MIKTKDAIPPEWSGNCIALMHLNKITFKALAQEVGCTREYLSKAFNGNEIASESMVERIKTAISNLVNRKEEIR